MRLFILTSLALVAFQRLVALAESGADCLYAPSVREPDEN